MATYKKYNFKYPSSYKNYMPSYTTEKYTRPADAYSDKTSAYASNIKNTQNILNQLEKNKPGAYSSAYADRIGNILNQMENRKFSYDMNADALYNQYKDSYMRQGKLAMSDTMGQASALTGGYGNSYSASAGNQAYLSYVDKLNDKIPELYQLALEKYQMEGNDLNNLYNVLSGQESANYAKYRDTVADYQTDRGYYSGELNNYRQMGQNLWGQNWNNYFGTQELNESRKQNAQDLALQLYGNALENYRWGEQQTASNKAAALAEDQWNKEFAENQRQFNASLASSGSSGGGSYRSSGSSGSGSSGKSGSKSGSSSGGGSGSGNTVSSSAASSFYTQNGVTRYKEPDKQFTQAQYSGWQTSVGMNRTKEGRCAAIDDAYMEGKITAGQARATMKKFNISEAEFAKIRVGSNLSKAIYH